MSTAAASPAAAVGMDASSRPRVYWPTLRRAIRDAHDSKRVHAVRVRPDGTIEFVLNREAKEKEQQPSQAKTLDEEQPPKLSRKKQRSRDRKAKFREEYPHGKAADRAPLPPQPKTNTSEPVAIHVTATPTNCTSLFHDKAFLLSNRAVDSILMPPPPPRQSQQMRETDTFDQRETPALIRGGQSKPDSSANAPHPGCIFGPSKREAALAGAHKSPTKFDGVVFKKTRATYIPPYPL